MWFGSTEPNRKFLDSGSIEPNPNLAWFGSIQFVQSVSFGGDSVIAENTRDEQRKFIKYNHLVANLVVFHNIVTLSRALERLQADGLKASAQAGAA